MLRFRTLYRALKQNTSYQLNHVRGNRYKRDEFGFLHERPDSSRKIKEWKKKHRQEVAAGKKDQVVTKKNLLFVNEKNFLFVKCMIENHRQVGAIYIATVKESKAKFSELYPKEGEKNLNSVRSIGGHAKVQFDVDPADAARIKLISKSQKLDQIFYIDPSQEGDMMKFLKMCAEMLNEGGEIHMILKETDFQLFKVEEHARAVKIFIKEVTEFFEGYCVGFTLSHVNASEAMIYKLELDTSRKVTTASEALEESNSKESELVDRSLVNTAFGRGLLALSTRDSNESKLASEFVGEFLGRDMSKPLADLERTKLHYHESGRASEVNPSVGQWNMTDLDMINGGTVNYLAIINFLRQNEQAVGRFVTHPQLGEDSSSSIAAVVASMDWPQMTKYKALVSTQPHQQEIMQVLYTPKRGVIHGGLIRELLLNDEGMIRKACISLEMPPVTFALPGFCSRQGTSRSTHNHAENKFTADGLQMLTNSSCYMYARSTCSDSIVQRAYYAHPAAVRGLSYMEGDKSDSDSRGQRATTDRVAEVLSLPLIHDN